MKTVMIAAAVIALGAAAPALAGAKLDANGDGKVTLQEMEARKLAKTMRADTNHDGRITKAEYTASMMRHFQQKGMDAAHAQARIDRLFAKADLNHDGYLSPDEIRQATARRFAKMDPSGSGYIPASELHHQRPPAPAADPR